MGHSKDAHVVDAAGAGPLGADGEKRTGRRRFLTALAGAFAALAARGLAGTPDADAANGDPVLAGKSVSATSLTKVTNTADSGAGLWGVANGATRHGIFGTNTGGGHGAGGVAGSAGVAGVHGTNDDGDGFGVWGDSAAGIGVFGSSAGAAGSGVVGEASGTGGFGVQGVNRGNGVGVRAESDGAGAALYATASFAAAVYAVGTPNEPSTIGVYASGFTALQVEGPAVFSGSGVAAVRAGSASVTVDGVRLTPASFVLATVQSKQNRYVVAAVPDYPNQQLTIYLNKGPATELSVAWFVVN